MLPTEEALKAKLLAQAEAAIEAMLNRPEVHPEMTLSEMERVVGSLGGHLEQQIMQELVNTSQGQDDARVCPECGSQLRNKGKRRRRVETVRGEIEVAREYCQCVECGTGFFPSGSAVGPE
jgi:hypothetical protein